MKTINIQFIGLAFGILAVGFHQSYTFADEYEDEDVEVFQYSTLRSLKELTPEEEALANEARVHIAKAIENNLVRLFAVANAGENRRARQEDEDEDVTPNPNVLPQVAQILGAIFTGSLNITRVVDRTFGLVPNIVRNQVGGIVKLLTGENMERSTTAPGASAPAAVVVTPAPTPAIAPPAPTAAPALKTANEAVIVELPNMETPAPTTKEPAAPEPQVEFTQDSQGDGGSKGKYRIRSRTKGTTTTTQRPLEDDEIEKLADELRRKARAYEPTMRDKEPSVIADAFRTVISKINFNMTEITRAVPSIFKGTRQAFTILENLGVLDVNDVLDELDLPALEEEQEEEEEEE